MAVTGNFSSAQIHPFGRACPSCPHFSLEKKGLIKLK
jgi:hypothetical protein